MWYLSGNRFLYAACHSGGDSFHSPVSSPLSPFLSLRIFLGCLAAICSCSTSDKIIFSFSFCLLLAKTRPLVPPEADIWRRMMQIREWVKSHATADSQLLKADISGYSSLLLGRSYRGDKMVCGEVQLGWERGSRENGLGSNGQGGKG